VNWKFCGDLLTNKATGVYYRPHVVFNAKRKKYVLWYNWYKTLWKGQYGVAIADNPEGPYAIVSQNVAMKNSAKGLGDFSLFVDVDAKGYIVYTTIADHIISIEMLTDDFKGSLQTNSGVILPSAEACSMFRRNGLYYVLADKMCQFCSEGSGAQVFTAVNPMGPYHYRGNINNAEKTKFPASATIDGDRIGRTWGNSGGWNDNTIGYFPDSLEFIFNGTKSISEIDLFTIQDGNPTIPTEKMTFSTGGITTFDLEYLDGSIWKMIPGGSISGNNLVWRKISFSAIFTNKIRLIVRDSKSNDFSRVIELEAYENGVNVAAKANGGWVRSSSEYLDASDNIIHAQQTHIAEISTAAGMAYIWMADRWGSSPDGIKGHDFQYWGEPLAFGADGSIEKMKFVNNFELRLSVNTGTGEVSNDQECPVKAFVRSNKELIVLSDSNLDAFISITNTSGVTVLKQKLYLNAGVPFYVEGTGSYSGIYMIQTVASGTVYTSKIFF